MLWSESPSVVSNTLWPHGPWHLTLKSLSRVQLCNSTDCSLPGSSIHGTFQARVLEWIAISFSRRSYRPRDQTQVSHIVGRHFTVWVTVHGILGARIREWVAGPFSRGSSQPRDWTQLSVIAGWFFTSWATNEAHIAAVSAGILSLLSIKYPVRSSYSYLFNG